MAGFGTVVAVKRRRERERINSEIDAVPGLTDFEREYRLSRYLEQTDTPGAIAGQLRALTIARTEALERNEGRLPTLADEEAGRRRSIRDVLRRRRGRSSTFLTEPLGGYGP